jgi:molybdate transport system permease protein
VEWQPLALSFEIAALSTALTTALGVALAWLLATRRFPGRDLLDVLVTAPLVMPPTVLGYYVLVLVGRRSAIGHAYEALTGSTLVFTRAGAVLAASIGALPLVTKSARAALEAVDRRLVDAARTLGAGRARTFATIQLPLAVGGVAAGVMLAFARSLGDFGVTLMAAGDIPGETQTASLAIYDALEANRGGDALGMVTVMSAVAIAVLYAANKLSGGARGF